MKLKHYMLLMVLMSTLNSNASEFFDYKIVASSANGNFDRLRGMFPSTNARGDICYVASTVSGTLGFTGIFVSLEDGPITNITPQFTLLNASYGETCHINTSRDVIGSLFQLNDPSVSYVDIYPAETPGFGAREVAAGSNPDLDPFLWLGNLGLSTKGKPFFFNGDFTFTDALLTTPDGVNDFNILDIKSTISATQAQRSAAVIF